jgi:hypothetical protein
LAVYFVGLHAIVMIDRVVITAIEAASGEGGGRKGVIEG